MWFPSIHERIKCTRLCQWQITIYNMDKIIFCFLLCWSMSFVPCVILLFAELFAVFWLSFFELFSIFFCHFLFRTFCEGFLSLTYGLETISFLECFILLSFYVSMQKAKEKERKKEREREKESKNEYKIFSQYWTVWRPSSLETVDMVFKRIVVIDVRKLKMTMFWFFYFSILTFLFAPFL